MGANTNKGEKMKKTLCDLCGNAVNNKGMHDGKFYSEDKWNSCGEKTDRKHTVLIKLNVEAEDNLSHWTRPVDLCGHCLRGLLSNLCNKV